MSEVHRFKFETSIHKGVYNSLERKIIERLITKEYGIQLGDIFYSERFPIFLAIIIEEKPPKSWSDLKRNEVINKSKPIIGRGPEQDKTLGFVLNALEGAAFERKDQVCYVVFTKRYAKEDAIEIQIGEYKNGKI
jgi:hypothetical protein